MSYIPKQSGLSSCGAGDDGGGASSAVAGAAMSKAGSGGSGTDTAAAAGSAGLMAVTGIPVPPGIIKSAINSVKALFGSKPKTYTPGAQRKYGGYQQEFQEGTWWYIPHYAAELWIRHLILAVADAGYPLDHDTAQEYFFDHYDALCRGKSPKFVRQVPMGFSELNMPYTGKGVPGIEAYMASEAKKMAVEFLATLPPGSTLAEQQAAQDAYEAEQARLAGQASVTSASVGAPAPTEAPISGVVPLPLPLVTSGKPAAGNPYAGYTEAQLKAEAAAVDSAIAYRQSKGLSTGYQDMTLVALLQKKALIMAALTPILIKKYGLYAAGGLTALLVVKILMRQRKEQGK